MLPESSKLILCCQSSFVNKHFEIVLSTLGVFGDREIKKNCQIIRNQGKHGDIAFSPNRNSYPGPHLKNNLFYRLFSFVPRNILKIKQLILYLTMGNKSEDSN